MALPEIAAALSATSGAIQLLKGINGAAKQVEINGIVLELQGQLIDLSSKIIAIQGEYDEITKAKVEVEKELIEERRKNEERQQYQLDAIGRGYAYRYIGSSGPAHYLCAVCFDSKDRSILHCASTGSGNYFRCLKDKSHNFHEE